MYHGVTIQKTFGKNQLIMLLSDAAMSTLLAQKYGIDEVSLVKATPSFDVATVDVGGCDPDTVEAIVLDVASYLMEMRMWVLKNARLVLGEKIAGMPREIVSQPRTNSLQRIMAGYVPSTVPGQYVAVDTLLTQYPQNDECDPVQSEMMVVNHGDFVTGLIKLAETNPASYGLLKPEIADIYSGFSLGPCDLDSIKDHFEKIKSHLSPNQYWYLTKPIIECIQKLSPSLMRDILVSLASMQYAYRHKWENGDLLLTPNFQTMHGYFKSNNSPEAPLLRRFLSENPNCGYYGGNYNQTHRLVYLSY